LSYGSDIIMTEVRVIIMLEYEVAKKLYEKIMEKAKNSDIEDFSEFYERFLKSAVDYAANRTAWAFMSYEKQMEDDKSRSRKHDAYMASLNAVCRNLGIEGIDEIMPDRKAKGNFACYIALFLSLEQR